MDRVTKAIERTNPGYFEKTLNMRTVEQAGSYYPNTTAEELESALVSAEWVEYDAPNLAPGCVAYKAPLRGIMGAMLLEDLPPTTPVTVADPKGTGEALAEVRLADLEAEGSSVVQVTVPFTTIILGDEQGMEVCFTFHPGAPLPHDPEIKHDGGPRLMTATGAMALGLKTVKIISA